MSKPMQDRYSNQPAKPSNEQVRDTIAQQTAEYLNKGGVIGEPSRKSDEQLKAEAQQKWKQNGSPMKGKKKK